MIEIKDIIKLQTNSETEGLSFNTRYLVQESYTFDINVKSNGFVGKSHFCLTKYDIEQFCKELSKINNQMHGIVTLRDNDSDSFLDFLMESNGHLIISGQVGGSHQDHYLRFKFSTDQTVISKFINDFESLFIYEDI